MRAQQFARTQPQATTSYAPTQAGGMTEMITAIMPIFILMMLMMMMKPMMMIKTPEKTLPQLAGIKTTPIPTGPEIPHPEATRIGEPKKIVIHVPERIPKEEPERVPVPSKKEKVPIRMQWK